MNIPEHLFYTKDHEWINIHDDGTATIGITDFAQGELGDIVFVELNEIGDLCEIEETYVPLDGKIIEINEALEDEPELVNDDPYGQGWMIKITISNPDQQSELLDSEAYQALV